MKKYIFFILLVTVFFNCFAGGLSSWQEETPYGHKIEHDGTADGWVCLSLDTNSVCFKQFYFYKGYTIAQSDSLYYIINEHKESIQKFVNKQQWLNAVKFQNLKPFFKREYNANYSSAFGDGILMMIVFFPVPLLLPLLWLICLFSLLFTWQWAMGFRKHFSWIYPAIILMMLLYSNLPQSF